MSTPEPVKLPGTCPTCNNVQPITRFCKKCRYRVELTCGPTCWRLPMGPTTLDDFICEKCKTHDEESFQPLKRKPSAVLTREESRRVSEAPQNTPGKTWVYGVGTYEDFLKESRPNDRADGAGPSHESERYSTPTPEDEEVAMITRKGSRMRTRKILIPMRVTTDTESGEEETPVDHKEANGAGKASKGKKKKGGCKPMKKGRRPATDSPDDERDFSKRKQPPRQEGNTTRVLRKRLK